MRRRISCCIAVLLLALLAGACQPVQADRESSAQPTHDEQLNAVAEVLFERAVELPDSHINVKVREVNFPAGFITPEHTHDGPGPRYIIDGDIEVIEAGETNTFSTGEVFWETGVPMTSENIGTSDLKFLIFELLPATDAAGQKDEDALFEREVALPDNHINVKIRKVKFPVGFKTPEHTHDGPGPRYVFNGDIEVVEAGETNHFDKGEVFWETGVPMTSENIGSEELEFLIVELLPLD